MASFLSVLRAGFRRKKDGTQLLKKEISLEHLPADIRKQFRTHFTPELLRYVGIRRAWTDPTNEEIIEI